LRRRTGPRRAGDRCLSSGGPGRRAPGARRGLAPRRAARRSTRVQHHPGSRRRRPATEPQSFLMVPGRCFAWQRARAGHNLGDERQVRPGASPDRERHPENDSPERAVSRETRRLTGAQSAAAAIAGATASWWRPSAPVKRKVRQCKDSICMVSAGTDRPPVGRELGVRRRAGELSGIRKPAQNARIQAFRPPKWGPEWARSSPAPTRRVASVRPPR
jgi:hypothetical protein